jgi:two-component system, NtrC family, sensor histidine kinase HydH
VFARPWALKLLAPTVLVSLALVSACIFGMLYLNQLHANLSRELAENVESTEAAQQLETTTDELLTLLSGEPASIATRQDEAQRLLTEAHQRLDAAWALANLEREKVLVGRITQGLDEFSQRWSDRRNAPPAAIHQYDVQLRRLLDENVRRPCDELRIYNLGQIKDSTLKNLTIVNRFGWGLLTVALGAPVGGLLLGYTMARRLYHSICELSVGIRDAAGRLNRELGSVTLAEEGDLLHMHQQMQGVLAEIERVVGQLQQREREVLRAEQLAAVGQVAAGVAHELRNPLTSVKMLVQTGLEGSPAGGLSTDDLEIIEHEIRRMEQRIQMFLDFARPTRSERHRTDLLDVARRAVALVEGRAHRQKVMLVTELPPEPVFLLIDGEQIHQVIVNLLLNALDALPRGGKIFLDVMRGEQVEVQIRDTGPGILPRIRARLFEPFVSSKETGVGLGLSICKRLIEAHGGAIRGDNSSDGGALFAFTLPAAVREPVETKALAVH